jgi:hypothetical protein
MTLASKLVDWSALGQVAYISAGAGLAVALTLCLGIVASMRAQDESASGRGGVALALNAFTVLAVLVVLAAIGVGIYYITQK